MQGAAADTICWESEKNMDLVMFDVDGTLCQTNGADERCYVRALLELASGYQVNEDWSRYKNVTEPGIASEIIEERLDRPSTYEELLQIRDRFLALLQEEAAARPESFCEIPGARAMLEQLSRRRDTAISLATGCWRETALFKMRAAGVDPSGFPMASGTDAISRGEILKLSEERASAFCGAISFHSVTYVGDAIWDLRAARSAGYHFVGVAGPSVAPALAAEGARHIVPDYSDLERFMNVLERVKDSQAAGRGDAL